VKGPLLSGIFPSLINFSRSFIFSNLLSVCCFLFVGDTGRLLKRRDLALGSIPEAWTLLVNRLKREVLFSLLCFSTFIFTDVIPEHGNTKIYFLQALLILEGDRESGRVDIRKGLQLSTDSLFLVLMGRVLVFSERIFLERILLR